MSMTLTPGTFYRMRNGQKAYVAFDETSLPFKLVTLYPIRGYQQYLNGLWGEASWDARGRFDCSIENGCYDLIAPWTEADDRPSLEGKTVEIDGRRYVLRVE